MQYKHKWNKEQIDTLITELFSDENTKESSLEHLDMPVEAEERRPENPVLPVPDQK